MSLERLRSSWRADLQDPGLRGKLLRGYLLVALAGFVPLLLSIATALWLRTANNEFAGVHAPVARQSALLLASVETSLAALRGWSLTGDAAFVAQRQRVWREEILPGLARLQSVLEPGSSNARQLVRAETLLRELRESQWWIEDVARTPGNQPALLLLDETIAPISESGLFAITGMIDDEAEQPASPQRRALLLAMANLRGSLAIAGELARRFVGSGDPGDRRAFERRLAIVRERLARIGAARQLLSGSQRESLARLGREVAALEQNAREAFAIRGGPEWNVAQRRLRDEAIPLARESAALLGRLSEDTGEAMAAQAATLSQRSATAAGFFLSAGVCFFGLLAVSVRSRARALTGPLEALTEATRKLGDGRYVPELPVTSDDEVGALTDAFNTTIQRLERSERQRERALGELAERGRELEDSNRELEASNRELEDFAYIASHDLKEPLRGIHHYAGFLEEDYAEVLDDLGRSRIATMKRLVERLEALIDSLLHYSRLGRTDLAVEDVALDQVLEAVVDSLHVSLEQGGVELRVPRPLPTVHCDAARVGEVFRNLIGNAIRYNDEDEKWVEVSFRDRATPPGSSEEIEGPVFHVRDNGIGIPERHLDKVFRIFKRLHGRNAYGGGTGAGMTVVKKIVDRHGGRIWIESVEGEGTTVCFTLEEERT